MRLFDGPIAFLPCVTYKYYERCEECKDEATCGIRDVFFDVRNKTVEMLKNADLASIVEKENLLSDQTRSNNFKL
jgi:DNA-binding IscR family transcriptional regulator